MDQIGAAYNVCLGQKDAVMPTKTALTTITTVAASSPRTTSMASVTSAARITSVTTSTLQSQSRPTQSAFVDSVSVLPPATSSTSATSAPAAKSEEAPLRMTPAQIAGLSVAAVAAFIMAIGLMALSVCLRRRRERKFILDSDEKSQGRRRKKQSAKFSHYVAVGDFPETPEQLPLAPPPVLRKADKYTTQGMSSSRGHLAAQNTVRPAQRPGVGTSNSSSSSSLPLDQIGLAISAELDGKPMVPQKAMNANPGQQRSAGGNNSHLSNSVRPFSTLTQNTVFEEDDIPAHRRSSMLLPTPPVPIPPIRELRPSRPPPTITGSSHQLKKGSELFLDIPVRHERPQPRRIITAEMPLKGSPKRTAPPSRPRLAPPIQMDSSSSSYKSTVETASSRNGSDGDIIDYYFTADQNPAPKDSPAQFIRPKETPKAVQIKSKKSLSSTVSRSASRASTNMRDSMSTQTSFETSDPDDTTPEDDSDDKQLSDDNKQLSPVAESPISNLRYPKVPRASCQLVPRSPKSPPNDKKAHRDHRSPRRPLEPSTLLSKRNNALPPLLLESRPRLNSPHRDPFTSPSTKPRVHKRSMSTESWTATPASKIDRKSRVQSGVWGKSPVMFEEDVVKPLNVRRRGEKADEMSEVNIGRDVDVDATGLKSPVWVPRLTPTRKGDDLFISVGWGDGHRRR